MVYHNFSQVLLFLEFLNTDSNSKRDFTYDDLDLSLSAFTARKPKQKLLYIYMFFNAYLIKFVEFINGKTHFSVQITISLTVFKIHMKSYISESANTERDINNIITHGRKDNIKTDMWSP